MVTTIRDRIMSGDGAAEVPDDAAYAHALPRHDPPRRHLHVSASARRPPGAEAETPRVPDAIYHPDGLLALGAPQDRPGRVHAERGGLARLLAVLAPLLLLLGKLKFLALFGKVGVTGVSMLVSIAAYAWAWGLGWAAATGFVLLLLVHEMGHWVAMRLTGVPASAPLFIPFLGAVIGMKGAPRSVRDEAAIGLAGPLAGTAGAFVCLGLGAMYGGRLWPLLAYMGLLLNLFNLLPVSPLDGGRIAAAISRWLWVAGLIGLGALFVAHPNPFLLLIALVGGAETVARFWGTHLLTARPGYDDIGARERVAIGALYFGLIALIGVTMLASPVTRHSL